MFPHFEPFYLLLFVFLLSSFCDVEASISNGDKHLYGRNELNRQLKNIQQKHDQTVGISKMQKSSSKHNNIPMPQAYDSRMPMRLTNQNVPPFTAHRVAKMLMERHTPKHRTRTSGIREAAAINKHKSGLSKSKLHKMYTNNGTMAEEQLANVRFGFKPPTVVVTSNGHRLASSATAHILSNVGKGMQQKPTIRTESITKSVSYDHPIMDHSIGAITYHQRPTRNGRTSRYSENNGTKNASSWDGGLGSRMQTEMLNIDFSKLKMKNKPLGF